MRVQSAAPLLLFLVACGGAGGSDAAAPTTRDSSGVAILEHPADAWEKAPLWELSAQPIAEVGGEGDAAVDLSNSTVGAMLADGRLIAATAQPPQVFVFDSTGANVGTLGRGGSGPGEYRALAQILGLGGDSVVAYDMFTRHGMLFSAAGPSLGEVSFPLTGTPVPPLLMGRLDDGTWVFQVINPLEKPPEGTPEVYRLPTPVLAWRDSMTAFDTLFMLPGVESVQGTIEAGGQSIAMGRGVAYGATPYIGGRTDLVWATAADRFVIDAHDATGALKRSIRMPRPERPVTDAERERFKNVLREQLERLKTMGMPPGLIESELKKVEETKFAEKQPQIGQMLIDRLGRVWVTPDMPGIDSLMTWGIFAPEGELLGRVQLPKGRLFAASDRRVVVRHEDETTGLVSLQVWGLRPGCKECGPTEQ